MRRINISPSPSQRNSEDDTYNEDDSIDEIDAQLSNLDDDLDETERTLTQWSRGSSGPPYSSASYTSYTGSPSYVSLPTVVSRPTTAPIPDPRLRLSRITERTEESRPSSGAFSASNVPEAFRSRLGGTAFHARSSTDLNTDRTLPPPGRTNELIAVFETQSPGGHSRAASVPAVRSPGPFTASTTGYGYGSTSYGYGSRPSSPSKSGTSSSSSYTGSNLLSPPTRQFTSSGLRSTTPGDSGSQTGTGYLGTGTGTYTTTPSTFSNTLTQTYTSNTQTYTNPTDTDTGSYTPSNTATFTRTTPNASPLRRPQTSPRSPLTSVRNIVALWKERTPTRDSKVIAPRSPSSPQENDGLFGIRRRVQRAGVRLRENNLRNEDSATPHVISTPENTNARDSRSSVLPPGFDVGEFSPYTQTDEAVSRYLTFMHASNLFI